ncbi:hypothetical protein JY651_34725 [Pyxidicoccus parkwayensis]|uniref:Uncharacterized protein n=1 Tax=Pyxidicoccus parkwayensis TaxID=2813578 RepID=A0ABX7NW91_9BACT|nr:hypothetical protein [Pyxidicoccus parkwaysis]QSQ20378.1 hypothetical protein JY651_34725 [Pyxidicoccus parkwaysis]
MSTSPFPATPSSRAPEGLQVRRVVAVVLAAWFALVFVLGASGAFEAAPGRPPLPIMLGFALPLVVFFVALWRGRSFRAFVLGADLQLLTAVQAWRIGGLTFIALHVFHLLPGGFAWPAGLGDIAIGLTAPLVVLALRRRPGFAASATFVVWNVFGVLDLFSAVGSGTVHTMLSTGAPGEISMAPMAMLPLVLVPAFFVPLFLMLHTSALLQARAAAVRA